MVQIHVGDEGSAQALRPRKRKVSESVEEHVRASVSDAYDDARIDDVTVMWRAAETPRAEPPAPAPAPVLAPRERRKRKPDDTSEHWTARDVGRSGARHRSATQWSISATQWSSMPAFI